MKWPSYIVIIRHGQSAYNELRGNKEKDPDYRKFKELFDQDHTSPEVRELAELLRKRFALGVSDYGTPLSEEGRMQSQKVGAKILSIAPFPDVVFVSPYLRTRQTFEQIVYGGFDSWPSHFRLIPEDRIREQEHGLSLLYSDWRIFQTFHPEQKALHDLMGPYWYQYPQGESVSMVRDRIRLFTNMLVREYSGKVVYLISHHLTKLCIRANYERLTPEQFIKLDRHEKPINCGVTVYRGNPHKGREGKLELIDYNKCLY
jgi:broad specificity phosphatase PhoE